MKRRLVSCAVALVLAVASGVRATADGAATGQAPAARGPSAAGVLQAAPRQDRRSASFAADSALAASDLVVLVHGLGRTPVSMVPLARALERAGYRVLSWGYSSTCCTVAELADQLSAELRLRVGDDVRRVHFVGHSLGTVIIRRVLMDEARPQRAGRVVMLAPPNQGSHEADRFAPWWGWLLKPLPELRTDPSSTARALGAPDAVEIGIIAGLYDGKVSLAETRLPGAVADTVVPATHSFLMHRDDVQRLTIAFLRHGTFAPHPVEGRAEPDGHGTFTAHPSDGHGTFTAHPPDARAERGGRHSGVR